MASLRHIADFVAELPDDELREVALAILRAVSQRLKGPIQGFWTAAEIANWIARDANDPLVAKSLQFFVAQRRAQLLDVHYIYFSPYEQNEAGAKIDDQEVAEAYRTGFLVDPQSGREVWDFEDTLQPYFVPAAGLEGVPACV